MKNKKTLYQILGVKPGASDADILEAYRGLSQQIESGASGLDPAEANFQLSLVKQAFWTLSDNMRRSAYDASLAAPSAALPDIQVRLERKSKKSHMIPPRILASTIGGLFALGLVLQTVFSALSHGRGPAAQDLAEKKTALKEFELTHGVSSPTEIAVAKVQEQREQDSYQRMREEHQRNEEERKRERQLEEERRYAANVSRDLHRAEERAREQAEREKMRVEEAERSRLAREQYQREEQRRQWQDQLRNRDN